MDVAKQVVELGLSQWTTMAEDWEREAPQLMAAVSEALAAAPWGDGIEGLQFKAAHFNGDGPNQMLTQCVDLTTQITDAGERLRTTVDNTLYANAATYEDVTTGLKEI
ncbi:hypothetical protein [Nonomuraea roseoviolacea]|uniref:WXG100 family type VII secretion target n=1 Tax=Nonomuraea roseoviolacea subsp. carminata TaxID=160689 RepID=A0ABT1K1M6_9ACTN|nr:hypothetical protein [Nonomuraea roseoviolacea]MCP2347894.1 hypothetical protein [Nonomuraea roseoviolacea subsp. carminata]